MTLGDVSDEVRKQSNSDTEWALRLFYKNGGGNKKVLQNVARFMENNDICSYKTKANLQKTKKNWHVMVTMKRSSNLHSLV